MNVYAIRQTGFSLIEVLVVLFIIGLVIGIVSVQVNLGGGATDSDQLQDYVDDFLTKAQFAEDQAILTGKPYGLVVEPPDIDNDWIFRWQSFASGEWKNEDELLATLNFPKDIEVAAEIEGIAFDFNNQREDADDPLLPAIIFYPGGEVTPFTMTLFNDLHIDESVMISSAITGAVRLLEDYRSYDDFIQQQEFLQPLR